MHSSSTCVGLILHEQLKLYACMQQLAQINRKDSHRAQTQTTPTKFLFTGKAHSNDRTHMQKDTEKWKDGCYTEMGCGNGMKGVELSYCSVDECQKHYHAITQYYCTLWITNRYKCFTYLRAFIASPVLFTVTVKIQYSQ